MGEEFVGMKNNIMDTNAIRLPTDAKVWSSHCHEITNRAFQEHQSLSDGYGIDWFSVSPLKFPFSGKERKRVLFLSPHSDDLEFAAAIAMRSFVQKGYEVTELQFTDGSLVRKKRGFDDVKTMLDTRIGEGILGAREIGVHRLGIITRPSGQLVYPQQDVSAYVRGFPEARWVGDAPHLRDVWVSLMQSFNPHVLFSPYPDPEVDGHPDHIAVSQAAKFMVEWGTEFDLWPDRGYGNADALESWYRYATWVKSKTLPVTARFDCEEDDELVKMKERSWEPFVSQYAKGYARISDAYMLYHGGMATVGTDSLRKSEIFNVWRPTDVTVVQYVKTPTS